MTQKKSGAVESAEGTSLTYTYYAKRIVQWPGAPPLYVFDISPNELLKWASVPRKAPHSMAGYQRILKESRADQITDFMQEHIKNIVPGSVIVASDRKSTINGKSFFTIEPLEIEGVTVNEHNCYKVSFSYEYEEHDIDNDKLTEMLDEIIEKYEERLSPEELALIKSPEVDVNQVLDDAPGGED